MLGPVPSVDKTVIKVSHYVFEIESKEIHRFLGKVWGNCNTHRASSVSEKAERSSEGSKFLGFIIEFECIKLHGYIELGQPFIALNIL